jgi:hypothetical protein
MVKPKEESKAMTQHGDNRKVGHAQPERMREHAVWLEDVDRWRADHRRLIEMVATAQSAVLEQDAALEGHVREIYEHEMLRLKKESRNPEATAPNEDSNLLETRKHLEINHARARAVHERLAKHHERIKELIEELLAGVGQPM